MSIIDTLITDRSAADLSALRSLMAIPFDQWTAEQKEQFKLAASKGAYNASDLNRVNDACLYLASKFREYGYQVDVKLPTITEGVSRLPEGYTELAWIGSTGTQYIDTGFIPNQDTRVLADVEFPVSSAVNWLFGVRTGSLSNSFSFLSVLNYYRADYGKNEHVFGTAVSYKSKFTIDFNKNVVTLNDEAIGTQNADTFTAPNTLVLFGINSNGTITKSTGAKIYSCQIYDNGTLVRDYIPCIAPDGEVGLYDIVSGAFYGNAGTGVFTAGDVVGAESVVRNYWKLGDVPQRHHMEEYLQNINNLRASLELASGTPDTPSDMDNLTIQEANDIEIIIFAIHDVLTRVFAAFLRSGQFTFWSGNRPLPTGNTDVGRTWAELDAMNTEWSNWQAATWYLLLYGNLQAEGVV